MICLTFFDRVTSSLSNFPCGHLPKWIPPVAKNETSVSFSLSRWMCQKYTFAVSRKRPDPQKKVKPLMRIAKHVHETSNANGGGGGSATISKLFLRPRQLWHEAMFSGCFFFLLYVSNSTVAVTCTTATTIRR